MVKYADVITQSFHAVKNITTGEGGAIITNIKKINDFAKIYRSHGIKKIKIMLMAGIIDIVVKILE